MSMEPKVEVFAAVGPGWDQLGQALVAAGQEDASGARAALMGYLRDRQYDRVTHWLGISEEQAADLRAALVAEWGEPSRR